MSDSLSRVVRPSRGESRTRPDEAASHDPEDFRRPDRLVVTSARRQATDFEQLEPEGLDLGEHAVQRGLVRQRSRQDGVLSAWLSTQGGERGAHHLAQLTPYPDLVCRLLLEKKKDGHVVISFPKSSTSSAWYATASAAIP